MGACTSSMWMASLQGAVRMIGDRVTVWNEGTQLINELLTAVAVTAGGLVFFAGTQDFYLRAYDAATGQELWKYALPVGSSATPMTYISPVDQRQYVVVSVGGAARSPVVGDYLMAFALPSKP